jgi:hypothetical protein
VLRWEDDRGPSFLPVFFAGGLSNDSWNGIPLPIQLLGSPGCSIQVSLDLFLQGEGVSGWYARLHLPILDEPYLLGLTTYWQAFSIDLPPGLIGATNWVSFRNA